MKTQKSILALSLITGMLISCSGNNEQQMEQVESVDSVSVTVSELSRDSLEASFISTINEIDRNLNLIRQKEGVIVLGPNSNVDENISKKERISRNIQMINSLLESNNEKINELEALLNNNQDENQHLKKILDSRETQYATLFKDNEKLKIQLKNKNFKIEDLNKKLTASETQAEILNWMIDDLNFELNKAFYVVGTYKELKDHELVEKNGGILGIGSTKSLDENFDQTYFTRIDKSQTEFIPIYGKKVKLLSKHPSDSYSLVEVDDIITKLQILDPQNFWKVNEFLVIEITT